MPGDNAIAAQSREPKARSRPREKTRRANRSNNKKNRRAKNKTKTKKGATETEAGAATTTAAGKMTRNRTRMEPTPLPAPSRSCSVRDSGENQVDSSHCTCNGQHFKAVDEPRLPGGGPLMLPPAISRDFRDPAEVHERTPTPEEIRDPAFRKFLKLLRPDEMRMVKPTPLPTARRLQCVENLLQYVYQRVQDTGEDETDFDVMFGFIVYFDPGCHFQRANGHVWLKRKSDSLWIDPTPPPDPDDDVLLLVRSEAFLTKHERKMVLASPNCFTLGAMVSHRLVPAQFIQADFPYEVMGVMHHAVATPAEQLRVYSLTEKRKPGTRVVAIEYAEQTRATVSSVRKEDVVVKPSDFPGADLDGDEGESAEVSAITRKAKYEELISGSDPDGARPTRTQSTPAAIHT